MDGWGYFKNLLIYLKRRFLYIDVENLLNFKVIIYGIFFNVLKVYS